jgi:flagellar basal-body rod protein FlgB
VAGKLGGGGAGGAAGFGVAAAAATATGGGAAALVAAGAATAALVKTTKPISAAVSRAPKMFKLGLTVFIHPSRVMSDDMPILSTLKSRLHYLADRQQVIAQNVANSDTPGFTPKDLKPFTLPGQGGAAGGLAPITPTRTNPMHMSAPAQTASGSKPVDTPDSETTLNGNSVVLEDQMMKMTQARMDYDAAVTFYQQSMTLLQTAAKSTSS